MKPSRMRLGCLAYFNIPTGADTAVNEAEPHAPRMPANASSRNIGGWNVLMKPSRMRLGCPPPYKPLDTHAISLRFRPVALKDERSVLDSARDHIDHVKQPTISTI